MYRASSGALVFGAGTVQWAWGLDNNHSGGSATTSDDAVRQATVNLFADMGVQPATLQSGLSAATASSDTTAPTSTIIGPGRRRYRSGRPAANRQRHSNRCRRRQGRRRRGLDRQRHVLASSDRPRLLVLHVHPRQQRDPDDPYACYRRQPPDRDTVGRPHHHCRHRNAAATRQLPVHHLAEHRDPGCRRRIPTPSAIEVGVKFRANQAGFITGIRFYKGSGNTGTHVGSLWSASGTKLGSATFTGESASGWQQVNFASPVAVAANTTYVASYYAPNGRYSTSDGYFTTPTTNGPLTALQDGADGANGVYKYGAAGFPTVGYAASNYWVDVVYTTSTSDTTKPTVTDKQPASGATGVATSTDVTATFSEPVTAVIDHHDAPRQQRRAVGGSTGLRLGHPTGHVHPVVGAEGLETYTASVSGATDAAGNTMDPVSWSFTTAAAPPADTTPPTITAGRPRPELPACPPPRRSPPPSVRRSSPARST